MHFNINSPFWQFMSLCVRYFILNLLFIITLVPVVTIGPACAALYSTIFAYHNDEDINLGREYLKRFYREFFKALVSSLIFLILATACIFAFFFWIHQKTASSSLALPILIIASFFLLITFEYYYPLQARYDNNFWKTMKNSFLLPWTSCRLTLALAAIDIAAIALFIYTSYVRIVFLLLGFSWLAYAKSFIFLKVFQIAEFPAEHNDIVTS